MGIQALFKIVGSNSQWRKVSLERIKYMDDLTRAVYKTMKPELFWNSTTKAKSNDDKDPANAVEPDSEVKPHTVPEQVPSPVESSTRKIRSFLIPPPAPGKWTDLFFKLYLPFTALPIWG